MDDGAFFIEGGGGLNHKYSKNCILDKRALNTMSSIKVKINIIEVFI